MKIGMIYLTLILSFFIMSCSAPNVLVGKTTLEEFTKKYSTTMVEANSNWTVYRRRGAGNGFTDFTFYYFDKNGILREVNKGESEPNIRIEHKY